MSTPTHPLLLNQALHSFNIAAACRAGAIGAAKSFSAGVLDADGDSLEALFSRDSGDFTVRGSSSAAAMLHSCTSAQAPVHSALCAPPATQCSWASSSTSLSVLGARPLQQLPCGAQLSDSTGTSAGSDWDMWEAEVLLAGDLAADSCSPGTGSGHGTPLSETTGQKSRRMQMLGGPSLRLLRHGLPDEDRAVQAGVAQRLAAAATAQKRACGHQAAHTRLQPMQAWQPVARGFRCRE
ncbi:hypothetical protein V8C86DRAFT_2556565 [Haematococcus lacustris]